MKFHIVCSITGAILAGTLFSACSTLQSASNSESGLPETAQAIHDFSKEKEIVGIMINAFRDGNYTDFAAVFPEDLKKSLTKQLFEEGRKKVLDNAGKPGDFVFVTDLKTPLFKTLIWKVNFMRDNNGKKLEHQMLLKTVFGAVDGKMMVYGFFFL